MNKQIGSDLRTLFVIQALATGIIGVLAMIYPSFVIRISGVDPNSIPVMQQTGGLSVGYAVAALLALRATSWEQVRVFVAAGLTANLMSLIGAVYYLSFIGVVSTGLLFLLAVSAVLSLGFVYAWRKYDGAGMAEPMAGGSITSA